MSDAASYRRSCGPGLGLWPAQTYFLGLICAWRWQAFPNCPVDATLPISMIEPSLIIQERGRILERMCDYFVHKADTMALFVRGSIAEGTADPWSDIDFAVVVKDASFERFCTERHSAPQQWGDLLFNSGAMGPNMCVSHFAPFIKVDVFYYCAADLSPSPWHARGLRILHDPHGVVRELCERSRPDVVPCRTGDCQPEHQPSPCQCPRGAPPSGTGRTGPTRSRSSTVFVTTWPWRMTSCTTIRPWGCRHFEARCTDPRLLAALGAAYPRGHEPAAILQAVQALVPMLREQIAAMAAKFSLDRCGEHDEATLTIVSEWQTPPKDDHMKTLETPPAPQPLPLLVPARRHPVM